MIKALLGAVGGALMGIGIGQICSAVGMTAGHTGLVVMLVVGGTVSIALAMTLAIKAIDQ